MRLRTGSISTQEEWFGRALGVQSALNLLTYHDTKIKCQGRMCALRGHPKIASSYDIDRAELGILGQIFDLRASSPWPRLTRYWRSKARSQKERKAKDLWDFRSEGWWFRTITIYQSYLFVPPNIRSIYTIACSLSPFHRCPCPRRLPIYHVAGFQQPTSPKVQFLKPKHITSAK
jgi:hypothetical protein